MSLRERLNQHLLSRASKLAVRPKAVSLAQAAKPIERLRRKKLARAKNVAWQDLQRGILTLSREELRIYPGRSRVRFWYKPPAVLTIPTPIMISFELIDDSRLIIRGTDQNEADFEHEIIIASPDEAQFIASTLHGTLEDLGVFREQAEKAEKERREREERQRKAELMAVQGEREMVWSTTAQVWGIVSELREVITLLRSQRWETIEAAWRKVMGLGNNGALNMGDSLKSMLSAVENRTTEQVYDNALQVFESLRKAAEAATTSRTEQEGLAVKYDSIPRWSHVPYFLLFALTYSETILSHSTGDMRAAGDNIPTLEQLAIVLRRSFDMDLQKHVAILGAALQIGDADQVAKASQDLQAQVTRILEKNAGSSS